MARPILAPALLSAALATSVCISPTLADAPEAGDRFLFDSYLLASAEIYGQLVGILAQCYGSPNLIPKGRVEVVERLEDYRSASDLQQAALAYDRGVLETRMQYAMSCKGAKEASEDLIKEHSSLHLKIHGLLLSGRVSRPARKP